MGVSVLEGEKRGYDYVEGVKLEEMLSDESKDESIDY